jgi:hypothetical protein
VRQEATFDPSNFDFRVLAFISRITELSNSPSPSISSISALFNDVYVIVLSIALAAPARAHTAAFANGMYCKGGNVSTVDDSNTNTAVNPLCILTQHQWWFQHDRGCDLVPPLDQEFLELPAGESFTVELAHNRAQPTLRIMDNSPLNDQMEIRPLRIGIVEA